MNIYVGFGEISGGLLSSLHHINPSLLFIATLCTKVPYNIVTNYISTHQHNKIVYILFASAPILPVRLFFCSSVIRDSGLPSYHKLYNTIFHTLS
jgi:hypothetical protein